MHGCYGENEEGPPAARAVYRPRAPSVCWLSDEARQAPPAIEEIGPDGFAKNAFCCLTFRSRTVSRRSNWPRKVGAPLYSGKPKLSTFRTVIR